MSDLQSKWIEKYRRKNAYFIHDGNPRRPHPELTSKKHSTGFANSRPIIDDNALLKEAAFDLYLLSTLFVDTTTYNSVVGPQTGATKLAAQFSKNVRRYSGRPCFSASPAKQEEAGVRSMIFTPAEAEKVKGKRILLCEDVVTTGGSIALTAHAIERAGGTVLPFVCSFVNRSGQSTISERWRSVALITVDMPMWEPDDCPLCKMGSKAIPAKDPVNWAALNAAY